MAEADIPAGEPLGKDGLPSPPSYEKQLALVESMMTCYDTPLTQAAGYVRDLLKTIIRLQQSENPVNKQLLDALIALRSDIGSASLVRNQMGRKLRLDADVAILAAQYGITETSPERESGDEFFKVLRSANIERQKEWDKGGNMTLSYMGNELAGETGELCNVVKKLEREVFGMPGSRATVAQAAEEAADVVICVDLLANRLGFDLWPAVIAKFNKTSDKNGLTTKIEVQP